MSEDETILSTLTAKEHALADDIHKAIHTLVAISEPALYIFEPFDTFLKPSSKLLCMASSHSCVLERPPLL